MLLGSKINLSDHLLCLQNTVILIQKHSGQGLARSGGAGAWPRAHSSRNRGVQIPNLVEMRSVRVCKSMIQAPGYLVALQVRQCAAYSLANSKMALPWPMHAAPYRIVGPTVGAKLSIELRGVASGDTWPARRIWGCGAAWARRGWSPTPWTLHATELLDLRCVWSFLGAPPIKDWRFPCKLPKPGPVIFRRVSQCAADPRRTPPPSCATVRTRPGRLCALRVHHSRSFFYGAFVRAHMAINIPKRWFLA
jgi:hypothetical protein